MRTHRPPSREDIIQRDKRDLLRLGYAQQLVREMGAFANFAISFTIISVLTGPVLLFDSYLKSTGPIINSVGWPLISLFTLCVAASMAELASAYPTAGGLYFWAFRLGGRGWAWTTAWLNMIGQIALTAGVNMEAAKYIIGAAIHIADIRENTDVLTSWYFQVLVMVLIAIPQVVINIYGIKLTAKLNVASVWWHIGGVLFIALSLTLLGHYHNSPDFLFQTSRLVSPLDASSAVLTEEATVVPVLVIGEFMHPSPLFGLLPFLFATLQAQWTYTGYDASAHVAEETILARRSSAWGIVLSVAVSAVLGYLLLMPLTWSIPSASTAEDSIRSVIKDHYPVLYTLDKNLDKPFVDAIAVIIGVAMWLCGSASITSMARTWYAFARDDGMPGSELIKRISPRYKTPVWSILITSALTVALSLYMAAFTAITSISAVMLYLAYITPVCLNFRNRRYNRGEFVTEAIAPWTLGRWSKVINMVAMAWVAVITVIFFLQANKLVLWSVIILAAVLVAYWFGWARSRFHGPTQADGEDFKRLQAVARS